MNDDHYVIGQEEYVNKPDGYWDGAFKADGVPRGWWKFNLLSGSTGFCGDRHAVVLELGGWQVHKMVDWVMQSIPVAAGIPNRHAAFVLALMMED